MRTLPAIVIVFAAGSASAGEPDVWWSLRPLARPAVPNPDAWCRTPVDAFVAAKLKAKGLAPSSEADRRTLVRRLTFDLTGLPPTPEEVAAFEADASADAYEKLVDRLLASPRYGERQARFWMDLAHFAETHGHDQDRVRPNAWRYRDYLIAAFNADTPYDRFVREQVAADVLYPDRLDLTPALGFLAAGPWDESSLRDIREDTLDRQVGHYLDRDDMLTTVMVTVQGMTVGCARCHDHKFDPIPTADYYRLQAVFAGVGRGDVPFDPDPAVGRRRTELLATRTALDRGDPALNPRLDSPEMRAAVAAWASKAPPAWQVLTPSAVASEQGATLTKLPDGSVRSEGARPEKDTVTATVRAPKGTTAVRLEVLTDPALPHGGPGRQDNGNLHLSEFTVAAGTRPVPLRNPSSDYDQPGWTVAHALDGNPATAWGVYPEVGRPHEAVFELAEPLPDDADLSVRLAQVHGGGHLIGRFRLSAGTASPPGKASPLPAAVRAALAVPVDQRTAEQHRALAAHVLKEQTAADLAALPPQPVVYAGSPRFTPDGSHKPPPAPRVVHVLKRGDVRKPGRVAEPAAPSYLPDLPGTFALPPDAPEGARRAALAAWLTDRRNPLTWRVAVNRVWQAHLGAGIVPTPSDFGKMGRPPSHPELLDWLAAEFRDTGMSLKKLHRLVVTSAAYRQAVRHDPAATAVDADNRYVWRGNRARLDAEQVRDAVLQVSGRLDPTMCGPSDRQFVLSPGVHVTPVVDYGKFDWDRPQGHRRSVYRLTFRTLPDPLVDCLDGADASQLTPVRNVSVTAPQALALLNNEFVLVHSKALADRLAKQSPDPAQQIDAACRLAWGRPPTAAERAEFAAYAGRHGLSNLCRVLLNSDEFLFLD